MSGDIGIGKIDEAVFALLWPKLSTTWNGFDWNAMERLYECGLISDPAHYASSEKSRPSRAECQA